MNRGVNRTLQSSGLRGRVLLDMLDAVVNNAAWVVRSDVYSTDVELFDKVVYISVRAPLLLIQAAAPHSTTTRGCSLDIGSMNAYTGESNPVGVKPFKGRTYDAVA